MIRRSPLRRTLFFTAAALVLPVLACSSCKKPPPPTPDAEAPAAQPDASLATLDVLGEDAGEDADAEAGKKWTGPGMNPNEARVRACCNMLRARIKQLGAMPEAAQLQLVVQQCDNLAAQVHANPNTPELSMLKGFPGCQ